MVSDQSKISSVISAGIEHAEQASRVIAAELDRLRPDLLVAGPEFGQLGETLPFTERLSRSKNLTAKHRERGSSARRQGMAVFKAWMRRRSAAIEELDAGALMPA